MRLSFTFGLGKTTPAIWSNRVEQQAAFSGFPKPLVFPTFSSF